MNRKKWICVLLSVAVGMIVLAGCQKESENGEAKNGDVAAKKKNEEVKETVDRQVKTEKEEVMETGSKKVKLETSMGDIVIELNEEKAPITVANFLKYTEDGFFDGTIFHRVIKGFMVQGGGFTADMTNKPTLAQIVNEGSNGLKNLRGTLAMARTNDPDSASSQFFINHKDNSFLDYVKGRNPGYAVFAKVVEGMDVVDKIAGVKTTTKSGHGDVPVEPVIIKSAKLVAATE